MTENWSKLDDEIKSVYGIRYVEDYGAKITKEYKTRPRIQVWVSSAKIPLHQIT